MTLLPSAQSSMPSPSPHQITIAARIGKYAVPGAPWRMATNLPNIVAESAVKAKKD